LAVVLQVLPICRVASIGQAVAPAGCALLLRWGLVAGVGLGTFDAVSAASAYVAGMQNLTPPGALTLSATGSVGHAFLYRIIVQFAGQNPDQGYFGVTGPLPPGLTINTNIGANGGGSNIVGTPTAAGLYPVTLYAGNTIYGPATVSTNATITISGSGGSPPGITNQPVGFTNVAGSTAIFTVGATNATGFQWRWNSSNLLGRTASSLTLANVRTNQTGDYTVVVTNASGSVTSAPAAHLLVTVPPALSITSPTSAGGQFRFTFAPVVGLTNTVLTNATLDPPGWGVLTNIPPPATATSLTITDAVTSATKLYRVKFDP